MMGQMPQQQQQAYATAAGGGVQPMQQDHQVPYIQPRVGRLPADRPIMKLSVSLIETYKQINHVSIVITICIVWKERARARDIEERDGVCRHRRRSIIVVSSVCFC